jgi:vancomycin permeability regulator SanA
MILYQMKILKNIFVTFLIYSFLVFIITTIFLYTKFDQTFFAQAECGVVFGAREDSYALYDRSMAAGELWRNGNIAKIILSGTKNEVLSAERFLHHLQIPDQDFIFDNKGFNTIATLRNAKDKCTSFVFISNDFHMGRIHFLFNKLGIKNAYLHSAPYLNGRYIKHYYFVFREIIATIFYFFQF